MGVARAWKKARPEDMQMSEACWPSPTSEVTARAGNRRFELLSALRTHTNAPYNTRFTMENAKGA